MNIALVFPGQGSQSVGMGKDLFSAFSSAKEVFEEVNDALSENLSDLMFNGSADELNLTCNTQPAVMAVSIAVLRILEKEAGFSLKDNKVLFAAGHSLGEYSALCAAGSLSLADTARLLRTRGKAMQEAVPVGVGGMISLIGAELDTAQKIAAASSDGKNICEVSNDNSFGQVVLSGHNKALEKAAQIAKEEYAVKLVVPLAVSAPFHCSLMKPAATKMAPVIAATAFKAPQVPIISNVTAKETSDPVAIKNLLIEQITSGVKWRESVLYMQSKGIDTLLELGTGGILTRMKKRIAPELEGASLGTLEEIESFIKTL